MAASAFLAEDLPAVDRVGLQLQNRQVFFDQCLPVRGIRLQDLCGLLSDLLPWVVSQELLLLMVQRGPFDSAAFDGVQESPHPLGVVKEDRQSGRTDIRGERAPPFEDQAADTRVFEIGEGFQGGPRQLRIRGSQKTRQDRFDLPVRGGGEHSDGAGSPGCRKGLIQDGLPGGRHQRRNLEVFADSGRGAAHLL